MQHMRAIAPCYCRIKNRSSPKIFVYVPLLIKNLTKLLLSKTFCSFYVGDRAITCHNPAESATYIVGIFCRNRFIFRIDIKYLVILGVGNAEFFKCFSLSLFKIFSIEILNKFIKYVVPVYLCV